MITCWIKTKSGYVRLPEATKAQQQALGEKVLQNLVEAEHSGGRA